MTLSSQGSTFSCLPVDLLAGQLRACSAVDLAALAATARQPQSSEARLCLPLPAYVAREALGKVANQWAELPACHWLRLFHFLRCAQVACGKSSPLTGHLCAWEPEFVRCGFGRCEMPGEELEVDVALVTPLVAWRQRLGNAGAEGCKAFPLPQKWNVRADTQLDSVAPVTHASQVCAVVPLQWGRLQKADEASVAQQRIAESLACPWLAEPLACPVASRSLHQLTMVARALNRRGECSVVRTHRSKIHFLTRAQVLMVARSDWQPLLSTVLTTFSGFDACIWALVYTDADPGFYCFG